MRREGAIRVLLVDDHPVVLEGVRSFLRKKPHVNIIGEASDGRSAVEEAKRVRPDVILLDLHLPGMSGIEVIRTLRDKIPQSRILIYTVETSKSLLEASIQAGAVGCVSKSASPSELLQAIEAAMEGQTSYMPSTCKLGLARLQVNADEVRDYGSAAVIATGKTDASRDHVERCQDDLTARERQILKLIMKGLSARIVSEELGISYHTVVSHIRHIHDKLHVHNRSSAVMKARDNLVA